MKFSRYNYLFGCIAFILVVLIAGCSEDETPPVVTPQGESNVQTIDSYSGGTVSTPSGHAIEVTKGSVPEATSGTAAQVAFSVETKLTPPVNLPAGVTQVGDYVKFGPDGFIFRWPVRIAMPYGTDSDPFSILLMYFNNAEQKWQAMPVSMVDLEKKTIYADVLQLGFFTLAKVPEFGKITGDQSQGGFEFTGEPGYYYTLTVKSVTFKYPAQAQWYPGLVGSTGSSGSYPAGGPRQPTHLILPQGTYEIWISRTKPGTLSTLPVLETYTVPATGTINGPLTYTQMSTYGWTTLQGAGGGTWVAGPPGNWATPTQPMGTGQLQATLTWDNTSSSTADLDLHLYGPNDMHVYWLTDGSTDGSILLDRDWQHAEGHATENIYSVKSMPKGHYKVTMHHYGGVSKSYSVRVIINGSVRTKTGVSAYNREDVITEFDIN